ncbi:aldose 1-epimerase [Undibacterium sp.]|uniref:aldose 1-epimerase n=1 Tax=Undibacterium sp. TaxID=1914977 RepID=UPI00374CCF41
MEPILFSEQAVQPSQAALIELSFHQLKLHIAPEAGGSIAAFYSVQDGTRQHWLRPASEQALRECNPEGMASFPLIPFSNRLRDGRASFQGRQIEIPPAAKGHPLHGLAWRQPWTVTQQDAHSASLQLDFAGPDEDANGWPYKFSARQFFRLYEDKLSVMMEVENLDTVSMPLGMGHHPYFPREAGTRLTLSAAAMWQGDHEVMPTQLARPPLLEQLRNGLLIDDEALDNNFIGWEHNARVDWAATQHAPARSLSLQAMSPFDFVVLYTPEGRDFFCVEPVSNCTDWLNLPSHPHAEIGGAVLAPGDTYSAGFTLTVSSAG